MPLPSASHPIIIVLEAAVYTLAHPSPEGWLESFPKNSVARFCAPQHVKGPLLIFSSYFANLNIVK